MHIESNCNEKGNFRGIISANVMVKVRINRILKVIVMVMLILEVLIAVM